jgi:hypothetical protein
VTYPVADGTKWRNKKLSKKEQTIKEFLSELAKGDYANLWELNDTLKSGHPDDRNPLLKIFNEEQLELIGIIVNHVVAALEFHDGFEESHTDLRKNVSNVDAKLRNHRHPLIETFSAKPEF